MTQADFDLFERGLPECDVCGQKLWGGSHYHCGRCWSRDVTGMYGHYREGRWDGGKWIPMAPHYTCEVSVT